MGGHREAPEPFAGVGYDGIWYPHFCSGLRNDLCCYAEEWVMKPEKHIKKFYDQVHKMNEDGHIDKPDKYIAINKVELAIHELAQAFEREIE